MGREAKPHPHESILILPLCLCGTTAQVFLTVIGVQEPSSVQDQGLEPGYSLGQIGALWVPRVEAQSGMKNQGSFWGQDWDSVCTIVEDKRKFRDPLLSPL